MSKKNLNVVLGIFFLLLLGAALFKVVLKPVFVNHYINNAYLYARGRFVCTLDEQGRHVSRLYSLNKGEKILLRKSVSNSCIFSRPNLNTGFFVFAIGGGGGATPYESGNSGQVISKHININKSLVVIKVGKGGKGTFVDGENKFVDAKDGTATTIEELKIIAKGGSKSTRMTPLGAVPKEEAYHISEKYHLLYGISKSEKFGSGGRFDKKTKDTSAKAQSGHSGAVIIQW